MREFRVGGTYKATNGTTNAGRSANGRMTVGRSYTVLAVFSSWVRIMSDDGVIIEVNKSRFYVSGKLPGHDQDKLLLLTIKGGAMKKII